MGYSNYVARQTVCYLEQVPKAVRKEIGQFFTPSPIAEYMASRITQVSNSIQILDPGAGAGILSAAAIDYIIRNKNVKEIRLVLFETHEVMLPLLKQNMMFIEEDLKKHGVELNVSIQECDFLIECKDYWLNRGGLEKYDIIISNPPYLKIRKNDPRAMSMGDIIHGQPNLYFLFMALSTRMLKEGGDYIFITPRSFASGLYFSLFRKSFFDSLSIRHVHMFKSRTGVFADNVLQELIITEGSNITRYNYVEITESDGINDLTSSNTITIPSELCIGIGPQKYLYLPTTEGELEIINIVTNFGSTLVDNGYVMKNGPIVDFRCKDILSDSESGNIPVIWAYNFIEGKITYPIKDDKKPQYIQRKSENSKLIPVGNYLFVKRFTTKEETRRIQCAMFLETDYDIDFISAENHVNYITKSEGNLSLEELYGLYILFNSKLMDSYYRILNGSTQVNCSEINQMSTPSSNIIRKMGNYALTNDIDVRNESTCDQILKICLGDTIGKDRRNTEFSN